MIDYILNFDTQAQAEQALVDWTFTDEENGAVRWKPKPKCGILPIDVILQEAVWDITDPQNPAETTPEIKSGGYWIAIAMTMPDETFWTMPYVISEHDRALANIGQNHLLRTKLTPEQIEGVKSITPVYAGANYPF